MTPFGAEGREGGRLTSLPLRTSLIPHGHGVQAQGQRGQDALALAECQGVELAQSGPEVSLRPLGHLLEGRLVPGMKGDG